MKYMIAELLFTVEKVYFHDGFICLAMSDKKEIRFPVKLNSKLKNATDEQIKNVEIICGGTGLHWPDLDEDLSVIGIIEGRFGHQTPTFTD